MAWVTSVPVEARRQALCSAVLEVASVERSRFLFEGLIAGVIGYVGVVVCVGILDVVGGRALFQTPSLLGQILIGGFGDPTPGSVSAGPVFAFNGLHLLMFLAVGAAVTWLVFQVELQPVLWYGAFFAVMAAVLSSFAILSLVGEPNADLLPRSEFLLANGVAAAAIGFYLHRAHPRLLAKIQEHGDPEYDSLERPSDLE